MHASCVLGIRRKIEPDPLILAHQIRSERSAAIARSNDPE
jgi:hypothetical protein